MLLVLLITLTITFAAVCVVVNTTEEIIQLAAVFIAMICLLVSLVLAPVWLKVLIVLAPMVIKKLAIAGISFTHL